MKTITIADEKEIVKKLYSLAEHGRYMGVMIWGPPGVGKSAGIRQAAHELNTKENPVSFIDLRLSQMNPVDLRGLPTINKTEGIAKWLAPEFLPREGRGILFLDELNLASQSVMAAGYQLVLDRRVGDYVVPPGWIIVAAGNRSEDTSNITKMPPPLANRFIHLQIERPDLDEWRSWAVKNDISEQIVSFLSKMPQHLFAQPKTTDKSWPSPRSWEFASNLHAIGESIEAAVGQGVAAEFSAFCKVYAKMPDVDAILAGKKVEVPGPKELDVLWATCMSIVYRAEPNHWKNVYNYTDRFTGKEFMVLVIKLLDEKSAEWKNTIAKSAEWKEFYTKHPHLLGE